MRLVSLAGATVLVLLVAAGCGDEGEDAAATATTATTDEVVFEGDPDSPFCEASRAAADDPVLDPFEPGLAPAEIERRFDVLAQRFAGFADVAPPDLADDLRLLDRSFDELAALLASVEYDFEELARTEVDMSLFDDPVFTDVAARLAAYQDQVCER